MGVKKGRSKPFLSSLKSWFARLYSVGRRGRRAGAARAGPEAAMVAASKHFSSAHKVKFG